MSKLRDHMIPVCTRKIVNKKTMTVEGKEIDTPKKCKTCAMVLVDGHDFYETRSWERDYKDCVICYDAKKLYPEQWKRSKQKIMKTLRRHHINDFNERREMFYNIYRNEGVVTYELV